MTTPQYTNLYARFMNLEYIVADFFKLHNHLCLQIPFILEKTSQDDTKQRETLKKILEEVDFERNVYAFSHLQADIFICRTVDNFHSYLVDMLRAYFRNNPTKMVLPKRRGKSRPIQGMGKTPSQEIELNAFRVADQMQRNGFDKILEFLTTEAGLNLTLIDEDLTEVTHAIAVRNIFTHNRGRN